MEFFCSQNFEFKELLLNSEEYYRNMSCFKYTVIVLSLLLSFPLLISCQTVNLNNIFNGIKIFNSTAHALDKPTTDKVTYHSYQKM